CQAFVAAGVPCITAGGQDGWPIFVTGYGIVGNSFPDAASQVPGRPVRQEVRLGVGECANSPRGGFPRVLGSWQGRPRQGGAITITCQSMVDDSMDEARSAEGRGT